MSKDELNNEYFEWMYELVYDKSRSRGLSYRKLLFALHTMEFTYSIGLDGNRCEDGIDLRYKFGYEHSYNEDIITRYLADTPCSILEMMIALTIRCEGNIMQDSEIGDRTSYWFWTMIDNLGVGMMSDLKFDKDYVTLVLNNFLNRDYGYHGEGGLFTVSKPRRDMRNVEIWYQMCWYLEEYLEEV